MKSTIFERLDAMSMKSTEFKHPVHGYFVYECEECGAVYKMWLDKGLEDQVQDNQYPDLHKPVPFCIVCKNCNKSVATHVLWGFGNSDTYTELPEGANYFKNTAEKDCGVPIISKPDALNLAYFQRMEIFKSAGVNSRLCK